MVAREIRRRRTRLLAAAVLVAVLASVVAAVVFQSPPVVAFAVFVLALQAASFLALALVVTSLRRAVRRLENAMDKATEMARDQVIREVTHNVAGQVSELHGSLLNDLQALEQLIARYEPTATLPLVAGWAMSPTGLIWLVDQIERARPSLVVECGSGTSTLWMSLALRRAGTGRLVALEHVEEYAQQTRQLLERHGVADWAEVRHAPLTATNTPRGSFPWYELDAAHADRDRSAPRGRPTGLDRTAREVPGAARACREPGPRCDDRGRRQRAGGREQNPGLLARRGRAPAPG